MVDTIREGFAFIPKLSNRAVTSSFSAVNLAFFGRVFSDERFLYGTILPGRHFKFSNFHQVPEAIAQEQTLERVIASNFAESPDVGSGEARTIFSVRCVIIEYGCGDVSSHLPRKL